jgi:hypothetical protein
LTLDELKQSFLAGEISANSVGHRLKHHKDELDALYPYEGSLPSKFRAFAYGGDGSNSWCESSKRFRTFITMQEGFRKFCGNQSSCECNKVAQQQNKASLTSDQKNKTKEKRRHTNREKYGYDFASQHAFVKEKAEQTCLEKYGAKAPTLSPAVLAKAHSTILKNWGVDWPQQHESIRQKTRDVFEEVYGGICPAKNTDVVNKTKATNLEKYGVIAPFQQPESLVKNQQSMRNRTWKSQIAVRQDLQPLFSHDEFIKSPRDAEYSFQCLGCNTSFTSFVNGDSNLRCFVCFPRKETWGETSIKKFLQLHNIEFSQWNRRLIKPLEVDFFLPEYNLAIEFNGTWYHQHEKLGDKKYHQRKWQLCREQNVRLVQIWEHELAKKPNVIFDRLGYVLGLERKSIGARKCQILSVDFATSKTFINNSHLQGHLPTKHTWGLYFENQLLAVASFMKTRFSQKAEYELARFCVLPGYSVPGGLGKLLAHAQQELGFKSIVSYSNLNWGIGDGYQQVGFELSHISHPNYWYFKSLGDIQSRLRFQKHRIQGQAPGNTEQEIARNMGYERFFDAGNAVWIKNY